MEITTYVFLVLCVIDVSISVQTTLQKPCADYGTVPMSNFEKSRYEGQWFMHQLYDWGTSLNYDCYVIIRTPTYDGNQNLTSILVKPGLQPEIRLDAVSTFDQAGKGHYIYTNTVLYPGTSVGFDILSTDYVNYAIEWNCKQVTDGYGCYLFIMSRTPVVTAATQSKIDATLDKFHIDKTVIRTLDITSCPAQLLQVDGGPGLLERVLQIVAGLLGIVGGLVGGILG